MQVVNISYVAETRTCQKLLWVLMKVNYDGDPALTLQEDGVVDTYSKSNICSKHFWNEDFQNTVGYLLCKGY